MSPDKSGKDTNLPTHREIMSYIAEEIENIRLGALSADEITEDDLLWAAGPEVSSLGLDSLEVMELIYRVESRVQQSLPPTFDPMLPVTVGQLAKQIHATSGSSAD
jgi:acyl carrier protein